MEHFSGIVPKERWMNDLLNEVRETNKLFRELLDRNAQTIKEGPTKRKYTRRGEEQ